MTIRRAQAKDAQEQQGRAKGTLQEESRCAQSLAEREAGEQAPILANPLVDRPVNVALRARAVARLQRERGNQCAQRLLQAKLTVGAPDDQYEREADRVAHEISRTPEHRIQPQEEEEEWLEAKRRPGTGEPDIQRQVEGEEEEEEEMMQPKAARGVPSVQAQEIPEEEEWLQMKARPGAREPGIQPQAEEEDGKLMMRPGAGSEIPPVQAQDIPEEEEPVQMQRVQDGRRQLDSDTEERIERLRHGGQPINSATRGFFEDAFDRDFSEVRTHADGSASETAQVLNARALTVGDDILFGSGEYAPETEAGRELLAHELTHVVQQGCAPQLERAERNQAKELAGEREAAVVGSSPSSQIVQRDNGEEGQVEVTSAEAAIDLEESNRQEDQLNGRINGMARSMINGFCTSINAAMVSFATWAEDNRPDQSPSVLLNVIDSAFSLIPVPGAGFTVNIIQAALSFTKTIAKDTVEDLAETDTWRTLRTQLMAAQTSMANRLQESEVNLDFMNQLRENNLAEYHQVHTDHRQLIAEGDLSGMDVRIRQFLVRMGIPDNATPIARHLLGNLIAQMRFAAVEEEAAGFWGRLLPGMLSGEQRLYWEDIGELRHRLRLEGQREAYRRMGGTR